METGLPAHLLHRLGAIHRVLRKYTRSIPTICLLLANHLCTIRSSYCLFKRLGTSLHEWYYAQLSENPTDRIAGDALLIKPTARFLVYER